MLKIQTYVSYLGWVNSSRAGRTEEEGLACLESYSRGWPSLRYRLVLVDEVGDVTVIKEMGPKLPPTS